MPEKVIIRRAQTIEYMEKKSRFIAYAAHVPTEAAAKDFIAQIREKYSDATHHVYGYIVGEHAEILRCSDDGEPQGTAGKPVLEAIQASKVSEALVVVIRYFGGVLLGTGGLVRAYGKAAQMVLAESEKGLLLPGREICLLLPHELLGKVENFLIRHNWQIDHIEYRNNAAIHCLLPDREIETFLDQIKAVFADKIQYITLTEKKWISLPLID